MYGTPKLAMSKLSFPMIRNVKALNAPAGPQAGQKAPGGLTALLAQPGLREALMAAGGALMAQSDQPGSLGGALGQALPIGMQAFTQSREDAQLDTLLESAPPEMRQLLKALPKRARGSALLQMMMKPKAEPVKLGATERLIDPSTNKTLVDVMPELEKPPELPNDLRAVLWELGVDADSLAPEQRTAAIERYRQIKREGATTVNVGSGIDKLPVGVQGGIVAAQGVRDALNRFEGYATDWFKLSRTDRAKGQAGAPDPARDQLLGNLESGKNELLLGMKNLAELGVLSGPDMDVLEKMMGDPVSGEALLRSPEYTMTKMKRVREFVDNKVSAYERTYGIKVPTAPEKPVTEKADPLGIRR